LAAYYFWLNNTKKEINTYDMCIRPHTSLVYHIAPSMPVSHTQHCHAIVHSIHVLTGDMIPTKSWGYDVFTYQPNPQFIHGNTYSVYSYVNQATYPTEQE